jgi:DNA adenine methylase
MQGQLKSPLKRYGGKTLLVPKLVPLIPEHQTYVEVFAGSAALFFGKPVSPVEVINDLDSGIAIFFRVVRDEEKFEKLIRLLSFTPYSREEFERWRHTWQDAPDDVHRAHRWFITIRMSYAAAGKNFSYSLTEGRNGIGNPVRAYLSAIDRLPEIHERLRGVQIEHEDFREIMKRYDTPGTFFYLDPPSVHSTRKTTKDYDYEMTDSDHEELVQLLLGLDGKVMLSGYANQIYTPLERAGWVRHDFEVKCNVVACSSNAGRDTNGAGKKKESRTESVWVNC